jgi:hypothetical protein
VTRLHSATLCTNNKRGGNDSAKETVANESRRLEIPFEIASGQIYKTACQKVKSEH